MFFPQLYTTTSYSLLQSTIRLKEYVHKAKEFGYTYLAITDNNVLYGAPMFYRLCQEKGVKPIIGLDLTYIFNTRSYNFLVYAKDAIGYQELIKFSSQKMIHKKIELTEIPYSNHLSIVLPPCFSDISAFDSSEDFDEHWQLLKEKVPEHDFYIGVTEKLNETSSKWQQFLLKENIQLCAIHHIAALQQEDIFSLMVMKHLKEGTQISLEEVDFNYKMNGIGFLLPQSEIVERFKRSNLVQALQGACQLAKSISFEFQFDQKLLPYYPIPEEQTANEYLVSLCQQQLDRRVEHQTPEYQERLSYELSIIHQMGFDNYFLIVWDVMTFVHKNKIVTGSGRGSAAGSLVAYLLEITDVDPIEYDLVFERFLNPERYTMPDIDLDVPDNRREEVLDYVREKYGQYHMAKIATFGTMTAKMVLRDSARVFGLSKSESNRWSKAIPNQLKITLEQAYQNSRELVNLVQANDKNQLLFKTAQTLEGLPRHVSTHASGVVISDNSLLDLVPLQQGADHAFLTQYTMNDIESIGLLKIDFLGLRNLSIIDYTLKSIKKVEHKEIELKKISLKDQKTLQLFQQGETTGVFQFESAGIRNVLRRLKPESIEDIAAVNALYRPGPMKNIDTFIARKKGTERLYYPDDSLVPILKHTYGVIVYQEQIMQIVSTMAGFSLGQADILRRAISKKKKNIIDRERIHFVEGSLKQGYSKEKAIEVYDYIERFSNYGFNRSHAFAYSFVGFQMAYLKAHHPGAFFASLMNSVRHNTIKLKEYIAEARKNKLHILPPSVNQSSYGFKLVEKEKIRCGLVSVKGIFGDFIEEILDERKKNGPFCSVDQFLIRIDKRWLKRDFIYPLVAVGTFDELIGNRKQLMIKLEGMIKNTLYSGGNYDLLGIMELKKDLEEDYSFRERLQLEEEYLGVYISGHPTEGFECLRKAKNVHLVTEIAPKQIANLLIVIKNLREIRTKKGELMAFIEGTDSSGEITVIVFPKLYREFRSLFYSSKVIYVKGRTEVSKYSQKLQLIGESFVDPELLETQYLDLTCYLRIKEDMDKPEIMKKLQNIFQKHAGYIPVVMYHEKDQRKLVLSEAYWVNGSTQLKKQLSFLLKEENVVFK